MVLDERGRMSTDTSEKSLETLLMHHMTGVHGFAVTPNMVSLSRFVAYVVTGKLDVHETAAPLPDVSADTATEAEEI